MPRKSAKPLLPEQLDKYQKAVAGLSQKADSGLERNFFKRLGRLGSTRRFVAAWTALFVLLIGCTLAQLYALSGQYQTLQPVPGGIYTEGVLGQFTNANPLYASSEADTTVSRLIFSGLLKYNDKNQLVGDLASSWSANKKGDVYTVRLKPNLTWQDGAPLTADDVAFTYQTIQNPAAQSSLYGSWKGVAIKALDKRTVTFTLPDPLSSFVYNLTNGLIPKHLLASTSAANLRSADFNTKNPVGAGPFAWQAVTTSGGGDNSAGQQQISLVPFNHYNGGQPKLSSFSINTFGLLGSMIASFQGGELTAMTGLPALPSDLASDSSVRSYNLPTTATTMVFFNNSAPILKDRQVRQSLVAAADKQAVIRSLGYAALPVDEPLLKGQLGYNARYQETHYNPARARELLAKDGWKAGPSGLRYKKGRPLQFDLFASNTKEDANVLKVLQFQWRQVGATVNYHLQNSSDFQNTLATRSYDAVLDSIAIGVDPDVFVYWDSSQINAGSSSLNFSQYKSSAADAALEAGRTRFNDALRAIKYRPFLQAWQRDAPALGLYQPRFLYVTRGPVYGLKAHAINLDRERFDNVQNWEIRRARVTDH